MLDLEVESGGAIRLIEVEVLELEVDVEAGRRRSLSRLIALHRLILSRLDVAEKSVRFGALAQLVLSDLVDERRRLLGRHDSKAEAVAFLRKRER